MYQNKKDNCFNFLDVCNINYESKDSFLQDGSSFKLCDIIFSINKGERFSILGPSGCGKTTLLRIIAGLEESESGKIFFMGNDITNMPPYKRNFGMMFQDYALFPHKNVFKNFCFDSCHCFCPKDPNVVRRDAFLVVSPIVIRYDNVIGLVI